MGRRGTTPAHAGVTMNMRGPMGRARRSSSGHRQDTAPARSFAPVRRVMERGAEAVQRIKGERSAWRSRSARGAAGRAADGRSSHETSGVPVGVFDTCLGPRCPPGRIGCWPYTERYGDAANSRHRQGGPISRSIAAATSEADVAGQPHPYGQRRRLEPGSYERTGSCSSSPSSPRKGDLRRRGVHPGAGRPARIDASARKTVATLDGQSVDAGPLPSLSLTNHWVEQECEACAKMALRGRSRAPSSVLTLWTPSSRLELLLLSAYLPETARSSHPSGSFPRQDHPRDPRAGGPAANTYRSRAQIATRRVPPNSLSRAGPGSTSTPPVRPRHEFGLGFSGPPGVERSQSHRFSQADASNRGVGFRERHIAALKTPLSKPTTRCGLTPLVHAIRLPGRAWRGGRCTGSPSSPQHSSALAIAGPPGRSEAEHEYPRIATKQRFVRVGYRKIVRPYVTCPNTFPERLGARIAQPGSSLFHFPRFKTRSTSGASARSESAYG